MPAAPIPFVPQQNSGEELAGAGPVAMNVVVDSVGAVRRRPAIAPYGGSPAAAIASSPVTGLHVTDAGQLYGYAAGHLYRVSGGGAVDVSVNQPTPGAGRPIFAETEMLLVVAAGGRLVKVELGTTNPATLLGGDPPSASHVIANAQRLLANDIEIDRTKLRFSSTAQGTTSYAGHELWEVSDEGTAGFFTAEARPDPVSAVAENTNEVFVWGTGTLQVFAPDAFLTYAPNQALEHGISAPYSVVKRDQEFFWLDERFRFLRSNGRSSEVISRPIEQTLTAIGLAGNAVDCFGYHVSLGSTDAIVWTFPEDGRTFVWTVGGGWSQWSLHAGTNWAPWPVTAHTLAAGANVVGLSDGRVAQLAAEQTADEGYDSVLGSVTTGFQDRDTAAVKRCASVALTVRRERGVGFARGWLEWRDELGPWTPGIEVQVAPGQSHGEVVTFYSLGTYRTRQWRFSFDSSADLVLASARETFEVL